MKLNTCDCGHPVGAHRHQSEWRGDDCSLCECPSYDWQPWQYDVLLGVVILLCAAVLYGAFFGIAWLLTDL